MRAIWYDEQGPAGAVLQLGSLADPEPAAGEVRVALTLSGISPGDTKKRRGWLGSSMPYPRVVPHSDGAGVIDKVGPGGDSSRIGQRVWVFGAQSYRPSGTAAELVTVPEQFALTLPDSVPDSLGASLGIPGITAHRAVFADGPVEGQVVLVHGALGAVSSLAAQLGLRAGATVLSTVRHTSDLDSLPVRLRGRAIALDDVDPVAAVRRFAPDGVDRVIEVAFSSNVDLDAAVVRNEAIIAAYATKDDRPSFPFWPMLFDNVSIRLLGSDDFPVEAKLAAARDLTAAAADGDLTITVADPLPLADAARAHDLVDADNRRRVLLDVRDDSMG